MEGALVPRRGNRLNRSPGGFTRSDPLEFPLPNGAWRFIKHRMKIQVREIEYGSAEYREEVALRDRVLREPLGMKLTPEELALDKGDIHLAAFAGATLVGCMILKPHSATAIRMRQVAVDESVQGQGVGRLLMELTERTAVDLGYCEMTLKARESAVGFYLKQGYEVVGEVFMEKTGPHLKMLKKLTDVV